MASKAISNSKEQPWLEKDWHYRQLYSSPPDFKQLAKLDPDFAAVVQGRELDFHDPKSVLQLTKTLLKLDFDLTIELPPNRLCPPVHNRHNYILWLKNLLDTSSREGPERKLVGLDIGTGASCIYPLLGCTQRPWSFIATDIDAESLKWAEKNVAKNDLQNRIRLLKREETDAMIPIGIAGIEGLDFTMTNPPFYGSEADMLASVSKKNLPPATACTGVPVEMVTDGGEVGFVKRILTESLQLRERIQWYTAMFGFLSSVTSLIELLHQHKIDNYAVAEFVQGQKTRRWAVGWSFQATRPSQAVGRGTKNALPKNMLPALTEIEVVPLLTVKNITAFADDLKETISKLHLSSWEWDRHTLIGRGRAEDKVWSRAWRRKQKREAEGKMDTENRMNDGVQPFGFQVSIMVRVDGVIVQCRWLEGHDALAFESFRGYLKDVVKASHTKSEQENS